MDTLTHHEPATPATLPEALAQYDRAQAGVDAARKTLREARAEAKAALDRLLALAGTQPPTEGGNQ